MDLMQYVQCAFGESKRGYTYVNEGDRLEVGARVLVERNGKQIPVTVTAIDVAPLDVAKPVLGPAPAKDAAVAP